MYNRKLTELQEKSDEFSNQLFISGNRLDSARFSVLRHLCDDSAGDEISLTVQRDSQPRRLVAGSASNVQL
jgi:hypothetical protein